MFTNDLSMPKKSEFGFHSGDYQPIRIDCRAQAGQTFTACMREKPQLCQHSISIDSSYICNHPMRREIIERTLRIVS
jgi:hypothetical protein